MRIHPLTSLAALAAALLLGGCDVDLGPSVVSGVDKRAGLLDTDSLIDSAYDPYAFLRNAWQLQRRDYQVRDGKVPPDEELKDDADGSAPDKQPDP